MMKKVLSNLKKIITTEREVIFVSSNGIKSKKFGSFFLLWNVLLVLWTAFTTIKFFELRQDILKKEEEIIVLNEKKYKLLSSITVLEKNVGNIKNFIFSLNKYDRFEGIDESVLEKGNNFNLENTNNIQLVLNRVRNNVNTINLALLDRINGLEKIKDHIGLDDNIQRVSYENENNNFIDTNIDKDVLDSIVLKNTIDQNISYLSNLEDFVNSMPFSEPMQSNYISSKFGKRLDPFIKTPREHHGVDLVGSYMAKIHATAPGKVIFVGTKGGYGKTVILQHEHDTKTIYAHLHDYKVKIGDQVNRGDIIGIQGNTGRSTGQHLHYEIIKGRERYNPIDFINVGSNFY